MPKPSRVFVFIRPDDPQGYTEPFLRKLLTDSRRQHFKEWMRGQTITVCANNTYPVYYTHDVHRYIQTFGSE